MKSKSVGIEEHEPLGCRTSFRIGGPARYFVEPRSLAELWESIEFVRRVNLPFFVLGGGTNTLVGDAEFGGVVLSTRALRGIEEQEGGRFVVLPGTLLRQAIRRSIRRGWQGLERLVGIPGTVGGAVYGNAGAADRAIGDHVESVLFCPLEGGPVRIPGASLPWRYRSSGLGPGVIGEVVLRLASGDPRELSQIAKAVFRRKRATQPLSEASAGCVFRNPSGESAGRLIEAVGLKGARVGGASVSSIHANFIVNDGGARAEDVERLIARVRSRVFDGSGVTLKREIVTYPAQQVVPRGGLRAASNFLPPPGVSR